MEPSEQTAPDPGSQEVNHVYLQQLRELDIPEEAAKQALIHTRNVSAEEAAMYYFNKLENEDEGDDDQVFKMVFVVNMDLSMGVGKVRVLTIIFSRSQGKWYCMLGSTLKWDFCICAVICRNAMPFVIGYTPVGTFEKMATQVGHAAVGLYQALQEKNSWREMAWKWDHTGSKKVVMQGTNMAHLLELQALAMSLNLPTYLVQDAGQTQVEPGTRTILAIIGEEELVNNVTGGLKLL